MCTDTERIMAFLPHQLGQQQQQQLLPTSSIQNMNKQHQREIEKEKKRQVKKELRQHFNQLVRQAKKHEHNANSQNDKEELLNALLIFRRAQDVHDKLFGSSRDRSTLDKKVETLEQKCYDWEVGCESFAYIEIISDFEKCGIIAPLTENHEHWYQSHLTLDYHLLSRSNNNNDDDENENEIEDYMLPNETFSQLYDYQRDCVRWLWGLHEMKIGGILGDDMGLGKTVQTAAFLRGAFHSGLIKCVLLIVPVSVMEHWVREITKWCPENRILGYHTSITKKQRGKNLRKVVKRGGILITTYGMVLNNAETLSMPLNNNINGGAVWDYMILDEGHKIKNHTIGTAKAVREIAVKDCHRIILSGTFLQNSLSELWSLIDFISETRLLGPFKQFNQQFTQRINKSQMRDADACERKLGNAMIELLKNTIDPYLLRRTKLQIKNLNDKLKRAKIAEMKENNNENENVNGQKLFEPKILKASKREIVVWVKICPYQAVKNFAFCIYFQTIVEIVMQKWCCFVFFFV